MAVTIVTMSAQGGFFFRYFFYKKYINNFTYDVRLYVCTFVRLTNIWYYTMCTPCAYEARFNLVEKMGQVNKSYSVESTTEYIMYLIFAEQRLYCEEQ